MDRDAYEDRLDPLGLEAPYSEGLDSEQFETGPALIEFAETPFTEAFDESAAAFESAESFEGYEAPYVGEDEGLGAELATLESLLEAEAGAGSGLAERIKGIAAFVVGPNLKLGSAGAGVETLQRALVALGIDVAVDGKFGRGTERGVRTFQSRKGLGADGVVGPTTKTAIAAALGGQAPIPPPSPVPTPTASNLANAIVRVAREELRRWHPASGAFKETSATATPILQEYFRIGISPKSVPSVADLRSSTWHGGHPWSAVFISFVMRKAGAGAAFRYSAAHRVYVSAARQNRLTNNTSSPFWAYRVSEVAPQVGDLICNSRDKRSVTYDSIANKGDWKTHCDVVVEVKPGELRVVGGNVNNNVDDKRVNTDANGLIKLEGKQKSYIAVVRCRGPIGGQQPVPIPPVPVPPAPRPTPGSATLGRLVVDRHPLLGSHRGTPPDLILRWTRINQSGPVDVVVHFHGYSGQKMAMRIDLHKEKASGLDYSDPAGSGEPGRDRPTLGILPRGNYFGGNSGSGYNFPNITSPGAVQKLITDALSRVSAQTGHALSQGRLILTGHSGGGAPVSAILAHTDPDEVHIFDGMYGSSANVVSWARKRIAREIAAPSSLPPAMRILYRLGSKKYPGTQPNSETAARELRSTLNAPAAARLKPFFRVEHTTVGHNEIPAAFGWRLLANAAAVLPKTTLYDGGRSGEAEDETSPSWEGPATDREESEQEAIGMSEHEYLEPESYDQVGEGWMSGEALAWLDTETPIAEGEWEQPLGEFESYEQEAEADWSESEWESAESFEPEQLDYFDESEAFYEAEEEGYAPDLQSLEALLEAEAGVGTSLADRVKGIAEFVVGPTLRNGSRGAGVSTLQRALVALGAGVATDGIFSAGTEAAVRAFQSRSGLTADGVVGPRTKAAIAAALGGSAPLPVPPPLPAPSTLALCNSIARSAEQEYRRWHPASGNIRETDYAAMPILQQYYREAISTTVTAAQLQDTTWQQNHPWSALFVSWVMRTAGAGTGFAYSAAHRGYVRAARNNRLNNNAASPFWAYRATEVAPQVGDIIVAERQNSGATYDNIGDATHRATHGDIVTEVRPGSLRVIGGNVNQNVDAKTIRTLPDGRLALDGNQSRFFAVVRCRGASGGQQPGPTPTPPPPGGTKLTPAQFVAAYGASARASQARHGVPALVTLGQAALESGWAKSAPRFNFFGIKAKATDPEHIRQLLRTKEVLPDPSRKFPEIISITPRPDGRYDYVVRDWFRAYPDAATSFDAHGEFLVRNKRYAKAFTVAHDAYAFAAEVARAGYATDPSYEQVLASVMQNIERAGGP